MKRGSTDIIDPKRSNVNINFVYRGNVLVWQRLVESIAKIAAGQQYTLAITNDGITWAWGNNNNGQLGDNTTTSKRTPVRVCGGKVFCEITASTGHTLAITDGGIVWAWGLNAQGRLGDGTTTSRQTPVQIAGATKTFCKISAGSGYTLAIEKNGLAWAWGSTKDGRLGNRVSLSIGSQVTPVRVCGARTFCQISAGGNPNTQFATSLALTNGGRAWAWGYGGEGQRGDNSTGEVSSPISVRGAVKTFCSIVSALDHSLALDYQGRAWAWGANSVGQLGDNTVTSRSTPVRVCGGKTFCHIAGGGQFTIAIDNQGRAWAWGANAAGQLGDKTTTSKRTPVRVCGNKTFCEIVAGTGQNASPTLSHSFAIDKNGDGWAWGNNANGQLGDNTVTSRLTPVRVCKI